MSIKNKYGLLISLVMLAFSSSAQADYELPQALFGYTMILASTAVSEDEAVVIGFFQDENTPLPFVLVETFSNNIAVAKITSETVDNHINGKIYLPPGVGGADVKQLRINGYTILWKHIEKNEK